MAQTLNAASPTYTSGLLTGPIIILATQASKFKCGVMKVLVAADDSDAGNFAYTGIVFRHSDSVRLDIPYPVYVKIEFDACDAAAEIYVELISDV